MSHRSIVFFDVRMTNPVENNPRTSKAMEIYPSNLKELGRRRQDESPQHSVLYVRMTNPVENNPRTSKAMGI